MRALNETQPVWLEQRFWECLDRIERHHQRIQCEHETWRRSLDRCHETQNADLHLIWQRYCEVVAELEYTTAELEALRAGANSASASECGHEAAFPPRPR